MAVNINDYGGEFALIRRIKSLIGKNPKNVKEGIGDDCAVVDYSAKEYMLITADSIAENAHFSLDYCSPRQVGMKAVETSVSDIAAKGGKPLYLAVSLFLPENSDIKLVDGIYEGIYFSASKCNASVIGGNISMASQIIASICAIGIVGKKNLVLRKGAKIGDLIFCTGDFGGSGIGLELLLRNVKGDSIRRHLEPKARLELGQKIAKMGVNAMIDASDGLADIRHICEASNAGALIYADKIPISASTKKDAEKIGKDAFDSALSGGEDYELIFTASKDKAAELEKLGVTAIGGIIDQKYGIKILKNGKKLNLKNGFDHFKTTGLMKMGGRAKE